MRKILYEITGWFRRTFLEVVRVASEKIATEKEEKGKKSIRKNLGNRPLEIREKADE